MRGVPATPRRLVAAAVLTMALVGCGDGTFLGREAPYPALDPDAIASSTDAQTGLAWVSTNDLPDTARATLTLVTAGEDARVAGVAFPNEAGLLPARPVGYYRVYDVPKPESTPPTPWHLVLGQGGEVFWTANDFRTIRRVQS